MSDSGSIGAIYVLFVVLVCVLGLWTLAVVVLRRLSRQLDGDDDDENPLTTLDGLLAHGNIDESEYDNGRRELLQRPPTHHY